jgi:hypothetical protein
MSATLSPLEDNELIPKISLTAEKTFSERLSERGNESLSLRGSPGDISTNSIAFPACTAIYPPAKFGRIDRHLVL